MSDAAELLRMQPSLDARLIGAQADFAAQIVVDDTAGFAAGYRGEVPEPREGNSVTAANLLGAAVYFTGLELDTERDADADQLSSAVRGRVAEIVAGDVGGFLSRKEEGRLSVNRKTTDHGLTHYTSQPQPMQRAFATAAKAAVANDDSNRATGRTTRIPSDEVTPVGLALGVAYQHPEGHDALIVREARRKVAKLLDPTEGVK